MHIFSYMMTVSGQVLILFLLISVGFAFQKKGVITENGAKQMTDIVLIGSTPMVIIKSFSEVSFSPESVQRLIIAAVSAIAVHIVAIIISTIAFKNSEKSKKSVLIGSVVFSNCAFMSLPLTNAVLGAEGIFMVSVYITVFNVFLWTYGIAIYGNEKVSVKKLVLNPGIIGVVVGLAIFISNIELPSILSEFVNHLAAINTPIAMIIMGYYIATTSFKNIKNKGHIAAAIMLKMIVLPLLALVVLRWVFGISGTVLSACIIPVSAPVAASTIMFASKFNADTQSASQMVSITHIVSVITMPLLLTLCEFC